MIAGRNQVAAAESALEQSTSASPRYYEAVGRAPAVGAVDLPSVPSSGGSPRRRGFDMPEVECAARLILRSSLTDRRMRVGGRAPAAPHKLNISAGDVWSAPT